MKTLLIAALLLVSGTALAQVSDEGSSGCVNCTFETIVVEGSGTVDTLDVGGGDLTVDTSGNLVSAGSGAFATLDVGSGDFTVDADGNVESAGSGTFQTLGIGTLGTEFTVDVSGNVSTSGSITTTDTIAGLSVSASGGVSGASLSTTGINGGNANIGQLNLIDTESGVITSDTTAANATSSVAAFVMSPDATLDANDLILDIKAVTGGSSVFKVDLEGDVTANTLSLGGTTAIALTGTGANKITTAASDATTSSTVAALTVQATNAVAVNDLLLALQDSDGSNVVTISERGIVNLNATNGNWPAIGFQIDGGASPFIGTPRVSGDIAAGSAVGDLVLRATTLGAHVRVSHTNGANSFNVTGTYTSTVTTVGNVLTGEDTLWTHTLAAGTLVTTGDGILYKTSGTLANNANSKVLKHYFGAVMSTVTLPTNIAGNWDCEARIFRTGTNAQKYWVKVTVVDSASAATTTYVSQGTLTRTEASTIIVWTTAEAVASNDVTLTTGTIEAL